MATRAERAARDLLRVLERSDAPAARVDSLRRAADEIIRLDGFGGILSAAVGIVVDHDVAVPRELVEEFRSLLGDDDEDVHDLLESQHITTAA